MKCQYFEPRGLSRDVLLSHLCSGIAWDCFRTPGKVAYRWISAVAEAYEDAWEALCRLASELDPRSTVELIGEWERAVSLPDSCLPLASTIEERRAQVLWRLNKRRWSTSADWHELAEMFGIKIRITPGWLVQKPALFDACYDSIFWDMPKLGRFRVYVDIIDGCSSEGFDYVYDHSFPSADPRCQSFICLIERVAPANVVVIWNADPVGNGWLTCGA